MNFMQTAKGGSAGNGGQHQKHPQQQQMPHELPDPNPVPRPPSSTSGTSEILSVKDLEASMQKKANHPQQQQFAQGPKIFGTGRLMNRIPNLMDQQVALQNQQKIGHEQQQQQQQQQGNQPPHPSQFPMHQMQPPANNNNNTGNAGAPEDMFAFQNFLAQISKSGGGQAQQPQQPHPMAAGGPGGHPGMVEPGKGMQPPLSGRWPNCRLSPEEANLLANHPGMKMLLHHPQQLLPEMLNRQAHANALVKAAQAQAALRLSPNGE